jgi:hypothetical protein
MSEPDYSFITKEQLGEVLQAFTKDLDVMAANQRMLAGILEEIDITVTALAEMSLKGLSIKPAEFEKLREKVRSMKMSFSAQMPEPPPDIVPETLEEGSYGPEGAFIFGGDS